MNNKSAHIAPKGTLAYETAKDMFPHPFIISAVLCVLCTFIFDKNLNLSINTLPLAIVLFAIIAAVAIYFVSTKKMDAQKAVILLFAAGFVFRLCYVLYTNVNIVDGQTMKERQHDFYTFEGGVGHAGYIQYFFENGLKLGNFDPTTKSQFYHPPLFHMISAVWMYILEIIGFTYERSVASIQYLTLFYSTCSMLLSYKIFKALKLRKAGLVVAFSLIAFHPTFILLSGSLNNDMLSFTFILAAVYHTIEWYHNPNLKRICYIALSIGLGMFTKLSVALIAFPIAAVFIVKFIKEIKSYKDYFKQFAIFGLISIPLGMFYSLRNFIMFNVPLTYVPRLAENSDQYVGFHSFFERMFDLSYNPFSSVFVARVHTGADYFEYNPIITMLKSSMFGEYNFANDKPSIMPFCSVLFYVNLILAIFGFVCIILMLVKRKSIVSLGGKIMIGGTYFITLLSFIKFSFDYPHNCSMDFRYAVFTLVAGAFAIGLFTENASDRLHTLTKSNQSALACRTQLILIYSLTAAFCLFSTIVYLMLK